MSATSKSKVALIYPFDPLGTKVGGVETFMRGYIKHAPLSVDILHIGITTDKVRRPVGQMVEMDIGGRTFSHLPIVFEEDENSRNRIPLSLRFAGALLRERSLLKTLLKERVLQFNRMEPAVVFLGWENPKLCFIHNDIPMQLSANSEYAWSKMPWLYFRLEESILSRMSTTYTVNGNTLRLYKDRYPMFSKNVYFLPTWVDESVFSVGDKSRSRAEMSDKLGLKSDGPWILFAGRLQKQKNPQLLIQTFCAVRNKHPAARLLIVGEGNLMGEVVALVNALNLADAVDFLGFQTQSDLAKLYQAADLLLLTSAFEGMPRCVLEALGCGLPVVTTDVGEVRLVVRPGKNGEIVEKHEADAISDAVTKVLQHQEIYGSANCLNGVEQYRPKRVLASVYDRIAELCAV